MLTIRREQMTAFRRQSTRSFEGEMLQHITNGFPQRLSEMGEEAAVMYIRSTIASAAKHGIVSRSAVSVFLLLKLEFGEAFEMSPDREWARKMLEHPTLPGDIKAMKIANRLVSGTEGRRIVRQPTIR
jgi:hypothetical protein